MEKLPVSMSSCMAAFANINNTVSTVHNVLQFLKCIAGERQSAHQCTLVKNAVVALSKKQHTTLHDYWFEQRGLLQAGSHKIGEGETVPTAQRDFCAGFKGCGAGSKGCGAGSKGCGAGSKGCGAGCPVGSSNAAKLVANRLVSDSLGLNAARCFAPGLAALAWWNVVSFTSTIL